MLGELGAHLRMVIHGQAQDLRMHQACHKGWTQRQMLSRGSRPRSMWPSFPSLCPFWNHQPLLGLCQLVLAQ